MALHLTRIYTRAGDQGQTSLATGERVSKTDPRLEAYGSTDELNCFLGKLRATLNQCAQTPLRDRLVPRVAEIQDRLFDLGTVLASTPEKRWPDMPQIDDADVQKLEAWIDEFNAELRPLRSFVLPGTTPAEAEAHLCRAVCRRVERLLTRLREQNVITEGILLRYTNRLSDFLFVAARWIAHIQQAPEILWSQRPDPRSGQTTRHES